MILPLGCLYKRLGNGTQANRGDKCRLLCHKRQVQHCLDCSGEVSYFCKQRHSQRSDSLSMGGFLQILVKHWAEWHGRVRGRTLVRCAQGPEYSPQDFKYSSVFQSYMKCTLETQTGCSLHVGFRDTSKSSVSISALKDSEATCLGWG